MGRALKEGGPPWVRAVPEGGGFLQDARHDVHLGAPVAEPRQVIQILGKKAAVQLSEDFVRHKRTHDAQRAELLLREHPCVHFLGGGAHH